MMVRLRSQPRLGWRLGPFDGGHVGGQVRRARRSRVRAWRPFLGCALSIRASLVIITHGSALTLVVGTGGLLTFTGFGLGWIVLLLRTGPVLVVDDTGFDDRSSATAVGRVSWVDVTLLTRRSIAGTSSGRESIGTAAWTSFWMSRRARARPCVWSRRAGLRLRAGRCSVGIAGWHSRSSPEPGRRRGWTRSRRSVETGEGPSLTAPPSAGRDEASARRRPAPGPLTQPASRPSSRSRSSRRSAPVGACSIAVRSDAAASSSRPSRDWRSARVAAYR
jgi:hypothetical protein